MYNELAKIDEYGVAHSRYATYSYETDRYGRARLAFYTSIIQEAAGVHAAIRGLSITDMMGEGKTWVITRNHIDVHRYARWGEVVTVKTWAAKPVRLHLPRIIEGYDKDGVLLFRSTTLWAILDLQSGRPRRPDEYTPRMILPADDDALHPTTIAIPKRLQKSDELILVGSSTVSPTYDDTDRNQHVNNISYLNWALGALPAQLRDQYNITAIDASYLKQTYLDDTLVVEMWAEGEDVWLCDRPTLFFRILNSDGSAVWEAHSVWQKRQLFRA